MTRNTRNHYYATLRAHDISRAPVVDLGQCTLAGAKRKATREFGGGFHHHEIVIFDGFDSLRRCDEPISRRRISDERWQDRDDLDRYA